MPGASSSESPASSPGPVTAAIATSALARRAPAGTQDSVEAPRAADQLGAERMRPPGLGVELRPRQAVEGRPSGQPSEAQPVEHGSQASLHGDDLERAVSE